METFHGYDFETMTETVMPAGFASVRRDLGSPDIEVDIEADEDGSFMRGLMYGLLFTIPCWIVIAGTILAVLD